MKNLRAILMFTGMCATVTVLPAAVRAEGVNDSQPDILDTSAAARSGADRLGGVNMTAPAFASTPTGESAQPLSTDDTRASKHPHNRAVVGPSSTKQQKTIDHADAEGRRHP